MSFHLMRCFVKKLKKSLNQTGAAFVDRADYYFYEHALTFYSKRVKPVANRFFKLDPRLRYAVFAFGTFLFLNAYWKPILHAVFRLSVGFSVFAFFWTIILGGKLTIHKTLLSSAVRSLERAGLINIDIDKFVVFHKKVVGTRNAINYLYSEAMNSYYTPEIVVPSESELDRNIPFVMNNTKTRRPVMRDNKHFFISPFDDYPFKTAASAFHARNCDLAAEKFFKTRFEVLRRDLRRDGESGMIEGVSLVHDLRFPAVLRVRLRNVYDFKENRLVEAKNEAVCK